MSKLNSMVVAQYLWAGDQFVEVTKEVFHQVENGEMVKDNDRELSYNYILVIKDDPGFITFDVGLGNVLPYCIYEMSALCEKIENDDQFAIKHGYMLHRWEHRKSNA